MVENGPKWLISAVCLGGGPAGAGGGQQGGGGQGQRRATVQEHEGHAGPEERAAARRPRPPAEVRGGAPWPRGGGLSRPHRTPHPERR